MLHFQAREFTRTTPAELDPLLSLPQELRSSHGIAV
jgi:hypothetical protein